MCVKSLPRLRLQRPVSKRIWTRQEWILTYWSETSQERENFKFQSRKYYKEQLFCSLCITTNNINNQLRCYYPSPLQSFTLFFPSFLWMSFFSCKTNLRIQNNHLKNTGIFRIECQQSNHRLLMDVSWVEASNMVWLWKSNRLFVLSMWNIDEILLCNSLWFAFEYTRSAL